MIAIEFFQGTMRGAGSTASGLLLLVVALVVLVSVTHRTIESRVELDSYAPPEIPPLSARSGAAATPTAGRGHTYAGRPGDWRLNLESGRHPTEADIPHSENVRALQNLLEAAGGGQILDPGTAMAQASAAKEKAGEIMEERRDEAIEEMDTPSGRTCCGGMGPEVRKILAWRYARVYSEQMWSRGDLDQMHVGTQEMKAVHGPGVRYFDPIMVRHSLKGVHQSLYRAAGESSEPSPAE